MQQPDLILKPFAADAPANMVDPIPIVRAPTDGAEKATWSHGFPIVTTIPLEAGGIPPRGQDFNGVLKALSEQAVFQGGGGQYKWDQDWVDAKGGYAKGAVLQSDDGLTSYVSAIDGNTENFNTNPASIGASWIPAIMGLVPSAEVDAGTSTRLWAWSVQRVFQAFRSAAANATEALRGTLRLATQAEANDRSSEGVALDPKKMWTALSQYGIGTRSGPLTTNLDETVISGSYWFADAIGRPDTIDNGDGALLVFGSDPRDFTDDPSALGELVQIASVGRGRLYWRICDNATNGVLNWRQWDSLVPVGLAQTYRDVTAGRSLSVDYTNTTGRTIFVSVILSDAGAANVHASIYVGGVRIQRFQAIASGGASSATCTLCAIVPAGVTYGVTAGLDDTIDSWMELR